MPFNPHYTYLILNLLSIAFPLALSFDRKVAFWRTWPALGRAMLVASGAYLVWDAAFTRLGVWSFNPDYLTGPAWLGLPVEEWLFFLTVPYACMFVYACVKAYFPRIDVSRYVKRGAAAVVLALVVVGLLHLPRLYTSVTCLLTAAYLAWHVWGLRPRYTSVFAVGYAICLVPFLLINGVLTALPVVMYNPAHNTGLRIGTIPAEDSVYLLLLLLLLTDTYEHLLSPKQTHP